MRQQIDVLLDEYSDAHVAAILNQRGLRTGTGEAFDPTSVQWVRHSAKLRSLKELLLTAGMLTGKQLQTQLGISRTTLRQRRLQGHVQARICNELGEWLYWPLAEPPTHPPHADPTPSAAVVDTSTARGAV